MARVGGPSPEVGRLRARLVVRQVRRRVQRVRTPARSWQATLGPFGLDGQELLLRAPQFEDADAWQEARLYNREWLEPWWPVSGRPWEQAQSPLEWVAYCSGIRASARVGQAMPFAVIVNGALRGQCGIDAVDRGTNTGEISMWMDQRSRVRGAATLAAAAVSRFALTCPEAVDRVVAPISTTNRAANLLATRTGFTLEGTLRRYRPTSEGRADHNIWCLHRDPETITALTALVDSLQR